MRLVILGGSGSGKSTQAQKLCAYFDIPIISIDEILWGVFANYTDLSRQPQSLLETKTFVSHEIMTEFIRTRLTQVDVEHGWVLEGYPRSVFQAEELDFLMEDLGQKLDWAVYLQVPQAVMVSRCLGCFLPDDQPEIVQRRVELFYDRTVPILEYYDHQRRLLTINGDQCPLTVHQNIVTLLSLNQ
ncbi:nucleoside monophosphate kinase [Aetokthonos hydrillicola Thurmond2011]|uniref:Adenylate kinase n=3 Tax=Aetokthonos TaxID=1550243 RepID=A0AAP5IEE3_9CYAN|nr:nucleoside monophosphate kinase [Aetokthonos hydrillicola]MBO3461614.1 AAA family ATPase [Aetokthonos hydrillicola CCALA 1050]MBW4589315.1 nucleoside monophosphate kinase [Aetokthonos hydrillicola CCALA 1050]MDR9898153.1 nucleoside monophosphate kinase [Aetokthonos hydrillicola Thurmond2011]